MKDNITKEKLHTLTIMPIRELKEEWRKYFDSDPPKFNRITLERKIAYRIQEEAFGGLNEKTRNILQDYPNDSLLRKKPKHYRKLKPGTIITKTYNSTEHRVTIAPEGYEYDGRRYSNLSVIARLITGTRWSGPAFFGIEEALA